MPKINEYIANLENPNKRQTVTEIDLSSPENSIDQQTITTLINCLIIFSKYANSPEEIPHQVKSIKLHGVTIHYSELLAIINSGIETLWLSTCIIDLEETFTGKFIDGKFDPETKHIVPLRKDNVLTHLKFENCNQLPDCYLIYLLIRTNLEKLRLNGTPHNPEIFTNYRKNKKNKQLQRQNAQMYLPKFLPFLPKRSDVSINSFEPNTPSSITASTSTEGLISPSPSSSFDITLYNVGLLPKILGR